ncbi:hypothetical protein C0431_14995 [bacterium]|nr:hypothetical protein [bacterium]
MEKPDSPDSPAENPSPIDILHDQTEEIANSTRKKFEEIDSDFDQKLSHLSNRLETAQAQSKKQAPGSNNASGLTPEDAKGLGAGLTAAYSLIGTPIVLYGIGVLVDRAGNRTEGQVQFAAMFGFLGFILGLIMTIIVANRHNK